ncbi:ComEA family DNA-binding protein [Streptomyces hygroscopicus]|uniref:ComEA family DNA-binding protein n=1 Tax=Streptomyces hygroscopicus TaxID=1912 RepID=UPI00223F4DFC|nr:ComEA family DNA-binding protein [Streptomyces hygroscopicus]
MALRSPSLTTAPTSGPGRGPGSDGRTRHRLRHPRAHARRHQPTSAADALRLRAQALFAEGTKERREWGHGPPGPDPDVGEPPASTRTGGGSGRLPASAAADPAPATAAADTPAATAPGGAWRERFGPAVRERLPLWLQSRCGLERRSVAALGVLLVAAVVFAAQHFWAGRTQQVRAPEVVRAEAPFTSPGARGARRSTEPEASAGPQPTGGTGAGAGAVVVDVSGKVRAPGLQRLPAGSRVADALRAAGGVSPGTDTDGLNRARLLVDGEQIVVGGPAPLAGPDTAVPAAGGSVAGAAPATPVSLSTATVDQLDALSGVGPVLARHIVDYRSQHGGFRSVDELRDVNGIGERRFADLRKLVRP